MRTRSPFDLAANNLCAVFAERGLAVADLADTIVERVDHPGVVAQIECVDKFYFGKETGDSVGLRVDAFDQDAGEQEVGKYNDSAEAHSSSARQSRLDSRMGDAAEGDFGPAEAHSFSEHARQFGEVGVGVR